MSDGSTKVRSGCLSPTVSSQATSKRLVATDGQGLGPEAESGGFL